MESPGDSSDYSTYTICGSHLVDGVLYPAATKPEHLKKIRNFDVCDGDVYLCGYPKSGNIWVSTIIRAIMRGRETMAFKNPEIVHGKSMLDYNFPIASEQPRPGLFLSHLQFQCLPKGVSRKQVKIIYIARNPKDVAVSYYHFHYNDRAYGPWKGEWDIFLEAFLSGNTISGSWFEHFKSYWIHRKAANIFFIKYEDLKTNCRSWIEQLAIFLEKTLNSCTLMRIVDMVQFDNMKKNPRLCPDGHPSMVPGSTFMRKGIVGDWKSMFTEEQRHKIDEREKAVFKEIGCNMYTE